MAVEGTGNVVPIQADQFGGPPQSAPAVAPVAAVNPGKAPVAEDTFTPSAQNNSAQSAAQEAGIFQVTQGALTAATANLLIGQANANASQNGAPAQNVPAAGTNVGAPPPAAASIPNTPSTASQQPANVPGVPQATSTAAASANVQSKIQALNAALPALGLSNEQIQQIDRIASLVQDFNPAAYVSLVNQFEAQQTSQQTPAIVAIPPNSAAPVNVAAEEKNDGPPALGIAGKVSEPQTNASSGAANGGGQNAVANNRPANPGPVNSTDGQAASAPAPRQNSTPGNPNPQAK
jgi:hypothetical protein